MSIDQVRLGTHPDKTRLVLDLSEVSDFRVFVLSNPYRMVIDLPDFEWRAGNIDQILKSGITDIRHGNLKPGISRIVLDMESPVAVRTAFVLQPSSGKPARLVIDFISVSTKNFKNEKGKIHGTLSVKIVHKSPKISLYPPYKTAPAGNISPPSSPPKQKVKKPLVIIDPGHGGVDPGTVGIGKIYEKHVVLALAKELKRQLENTGNYRVLLTRNRDVFIKLGDRIKFARDHGGDLFVSIHADSIARSDVRGASVYTLSEKASDKQTAKLAARENKADLIAGIDLSVEDQDVANILVDLAMRDTMNQSNFFAAQLVNTLKILRISTLETPHRHAGFAVLKAPDIPSILIEAGFMSNKKEARQLNTSGHRKKLATAFRKGIDTYFEQVRKNQRI